MQYTNGNLKDYQILNNTSIIKIIKKIQTLPSPYKESLLRSTLLTILTSTTKNTQQATELLKQLQTTLTEHPEWYQKEYHNY